MIRSQINVTPGLTWPAISFIILIVALIMISYILWRRYQSRQGLMQRISELEALSGAGRAIVESKHDIGALSELIAYESGMVIDNSTFQIGLFEGPLYHILYWQIDGKRAPTQTFDLSNDQGMVGWVRDNKQPLLIKDFHKELDSLPAKPRYISHSPPRSALFLPLLSGDTSIGIIAAQHRLPNHFNEDDMRRLQIIANQSGAAFANAQLFARVEEQAWLSTAQFQIAQAIGQNPDMEALVPVATRLTAMFVGTSFCGMMLWDVELETYRWAGGFAAHHEKLAPLETVTLAVGAWTALDAMHVGQTTITTKHIPDWLRPYLPAATQSLSLYPLQSGENPLGVLIIDHEIDQSHTASQLARRQELIHNITNQLSQAVNNVNLKVAQQEEAWVNTALLQVAEAVNNLIDLQEILGTIVRLVPMLVGVKTTLILIWDHEQEKFRVGPSFGMSEMGIGLLETLALDRTELNHLAVKQSEPHQQVNYFVIELEDWFKKSLATPAALAFPLRARGKLVGVLIIGIQNQNISARRLNILNGIAQQAATAVVNNQLYRESAERNRLEHELDVARDIQASLIPNGFPNIAKCSVASYWQAARQVSGDFYDFLPLSETKWGIVVADVADKGVPAALFMALSRTVLRTVAFNRTDPADTLMRVNEIIDKDAQSDLFVTLFYAILDTETGQIDYANGGHNPPLLIRANGKNRLLKSDGIALGVLPDVHIAKKSISFNRGDVLILYTDGVTEAMNEDFDEFDLPRLILTASQARKQSANEIMMAIKEAIHEHVGETPQSDDITLVVMKREKW